MHVHPDEAVHGSPPSRRLPGASRLRLPPAPAGRTRRGAAPSVKLRRRRAACRARAVASPARSRSRRPRGRARGAQARGSRRARRTERRAPPRGAPRGAARSTREARSGGRATRRAAGAEGARTRWRETPPSHDAYRRRSARSVESVAKRTVSPFRCRIARGAPRRPHGLAPALRDAAQARWSLAADQAPRQRPRPERHSRHRRPAQSFRNGSVSVSGTCTVRCAGYEAETKSDASWLRTTGCPASRPSLCDPRAHALAPPHARRRRDRRPRAVPPP